ncbi:MAG: 30S ribosomal protein S7 [Candidatus Nanoarchaeia archaeon]|nr:30S ribosomal protein S7 [Candidatus Nanoarchaeia archaeon]MDD5054064.1 30S ribosomal protein S7 [Candidatus Nanoarchaeia archaeon]MDD5499550.1 30S ribosomal protein S7 [Candidatus Nanoarchaeia archaeon]
MKLFNKYDTTEVRVSDPGLVRYINLKQTIVPKSQGRNIKKRFWKSKSHIAERLMLKMFVAGHKGKKHWRTSGRNTGKYSVQHKNLMQAFEIIESKTKKNPVQVLVDAVANSSPCAEITVIEYGGMKHPKAVDVAPQRRIDLSLRWITQGTYQACANKKITFPQALANTLMQSAENDPKSFSISKKNETERQATASR